MVSVSLISSNGVPTSPSRGTQEFSGACPKWVYFHVPHAATEIPHEVRSHIQLTGAALRYELLQMTDHYTDELFAANIPPSQVVRASVSRLVVDVERFDEDALEPMAARGMGVIYTKTHSGGSLRAELSGDERSSYLARWYQPHHARLTARVAAAIKNHNKALIIDCHSYPPEPLPYETDRSGDRPEICIGTDASHTSKGTESAFVTALTRAGYEVGLNVPFSGALVPVPFYKHDVRVESIMIEVRRDLYMDVSTGQRQANFKDQSATLQKAISAAMRACGYQY